MSAFELVFFVIGLWVSALLGLGVLVVFFTKVGSWANGGRL